MTESRLRFLTPLGPHVPVAMLFAAVFATVCYPLTGTDIWWHLAAGRALAADGRVATIDTLSAGSYGRPWLDLHWLFQLAVYALHCAGGVRALVLGKCLMVASAALLLLAAIEATAPRRVRWGSAAVLALIVLAVRPLVLARPVVFTLLFVSIFLLVLEHGRATGRGRWLLALPLVQVAWSNSQPLFVLGPLVVGCYLLGDSLAWPATRRGVRGLEPPPPAAWLRRLWLILPLVAGACLLTPYGWAGLEVPLRHLGRIGSGAVFSASIAENIPPWTLERLGEPTVAPFKYVAALAFASFIPTLRRVSLSRLLLLAGLFLAALMANRNVLLFSWVAGPVVVLNLAAAASGPGRPARAAAWLLGRPWPALAVLALCGTLVARASREEGPLAAPAPFSVPVEATAALRTLPRPGHVFCSVRYGGYLAWALGAERLPLIDGRLVLRSAAEFAEYLAVLDHPERFEAYRRRYGLTIALLPTVEPARYGRLVDYLYRSPDWRVVYTDGTQVLFAEEAAPAAAPLAARPAVARVAAELEVRHAATPRIREQALLNLGAWLVRLGHHARAREVLAALPGDDARALLGRSAYLDGDPAAARALALELLERRPRDTNSLTLLARIASDSGQPLEALALIERALAVEPRHAEARQLLAGLRARRLPPPATQPIR